MNETSEPSRQREAEAGGHGIQESDAAPWVLDNPGEERRKESLIAG